MTFTYQAVVQDAFGVIIAMFSLRVLYFFVRSILHKGFSRNRAVALMSYSLLLASGVTFVASPFGAAPWLVFLAACAGFWGIQKLTAG